MKRTSKEDELLVQGYELLHYDTNTSIALPLDVAKTSRKELLSRQQAANEARRLEIQRDQEARAAKSAETREDKAKPKAAAEVLRKSLESRPEPGWYRVLPKLGSMLEERVDEAAGLRSADAEVNKRRARIQELLIEKGPDRRVARPVDWRQSMAELEAALPHFHEPIQSLRSSLALAEATDRPARVQPMLLLGPPGLGKTYFTHRVAKLLGAPHAAIGFDQPSAGSALRGSDSHWSNSASGVLFNLVCMGECANPVILLDELDKSTFDGGSDRLDPLSQLHAVLEPETSHQTLDVSVNIEFDASLVTYIATANKVRGIEGSILSRMEVFIIEPPSPSESVEIARAVVGRVLERFGLQERLRFNRKALCLLAHLSPRLMVRGAEKAVANSVAEGREEVDESDLWTAMGMRDDASLLH